jgi:hypothetical protein
VENSQTRGARGSSTAEPAGSLTRRRLLKAGLGIGAGGLLTAAGIAVASPAAAADAFVYQPEWRWCNKCECLFFAGTPGQRGLCAGGGSHAGPEVTGSSNYQSIIGLDPSWPTARPETQFGWSWCNRCMTMAYASNGPGWCPGSGRHDHRGSAIYRVPSPGFDFEGFSGLQPGWRWCNKCQALAYGRSEPGWCSYDGRHDHTGSSFYLLFYS